ncbi:protease inhibitor I42 family protein [Actinocorallia longicatena]|uniref:Proteinase inhibitor I42 chagasin domain-containing protein n=1 Tax=Actinocorallia longicatena TaxID=111803 RepID=A0ABP6QMD6_9ACTN
MRKIFPLVVVLALTGCGTDAAPRRPVEAGVMPPPMTAAAALAKVPPVVRLGPADDGRHVPVRPGQRIVVTLPGDTSTGYSWWVLKNDPKVLRQDGEPQISSAPPPGAGGSVTFRFTAAKKGATPLRLGYLRSWEKKKPARTWSVHVMVE